MVTMSSEYSIYLYSDKVDLRKGIGGRFFRPVLDGNRRFGKISWSNLVMLTEASVCGNVRVKYID